MRIMKALVVVGVLVSSAGVAAAQAQIVPSDAPKGAEDKDPQGWSPFFICVNTVVSLLWVPGLRRPFFGESETPEVVSDDDES